MSSSSATLVEDLVFWLPPQAWTEIFQYLDVNQLKQVRQTCSYLATIVNESPSFTRKVQLKIPESTTLDRFYQSDILVPARSIRLKSSPIESVDLWWPRLGRCLQDLQLYSCRMSVATLLGMLRQTPQLKRLTLHSINFSAGIVETLEDVRLERLEELIIDYPDKSGIMLDLLPMFGSACPWLKTFVYLNPDYCVPQPPIEDQTKVADFLKQVQGTINELKLFYSTFLMDAITAMDRMNNLKRVTFNSINIFSEKANDRTVIKFCRKYSNLEEFSMYKASLQHLTACWVIETLRNLKRATVTLSNEPDPLEPLPCVNSSLEYLSIYTGNQIYFAFTHRVTNLADYRLPKLKELSLYGMDMEIAKFSHLLIVSKRIHTLTLQRCRIRENHGLYRILRILPFLQKLSLDSVHLKTWNYTNKRFVHSLKTLQLNSLTTTREQLLAVAEVFPQLEQLHLQELPADDAVVRYLCQKLAHLRNLTIVKCPISDAVTSFIGQNCRTLERLELIDNVGVSRCAIDRLKRDRPENKVTFKPPLTTSVMVKSLLFVVGHRLVCSPLTIVNCLLPKVGIKPWRPDFLEIKLGDEFDYKSE